jgi:cell division protein FtsL
VAAKESQGWQLPIMQFVTLMLMTILVIALGHFARTMFDNYQLSVEKAAWQARIEQEQLEHERLLEQKAYVESDTYQRQLAHEMGLYAPDERPLVLLVPPEMQEVVTAFDPIYRTGEVVEPPYWQQWWVLFFGDGARISGK